MDSPDLQPLQGYPLLGSRWQVSAVDTIYIVSERRVQKAQIALTSDMTNHLQPFQISNKTYT